MNPHSPIKSETSLPSEPQVRSSEIVRCVEVSSQLRDNLSVMKRLIGDKWESSAAEYRTIVRRVMIATDDANPLACALPMAKEMSKRGHSPLMLLAVATEMSQASNAKVSGGASTTNKGPNET